MVPIAAAVNLIAAVNLACSGTMRSGPVGIALPERDGAPFAITYRIDLNGRQWCSDACESTEPVAGIAGGQILLRDRHSPSGSHVIIVNPATGRFTDTLIEADTATLRSGRCEPDAASGAPLRVA